jgi:hypothetical protein
LCWKRQSVEAAISCAAGIGNIRMYRCGGGSKFCLKGIDVEAAVSCVGILEVWRRQ